MRTVGKKRKKRVTTNEKFPWFLMLLCLFLCMFVSGLVWILFELGKEADEKAKSELNTPKQVDILDVTPNYDTKDRPFIKDTVYDGTTQLPKEVFQIPFYYPFDTPGDTYEPNKTFIKKLRETEVNEIMGTASSFTETLLSGDFHEIGQDREGYVKKLEEQLCDADLTCNFDLEEREHLSKAIADWYIESEADLDVKAVTDKSMICKNGYVSCRVMAYLTVNQIRNGKDLKEKLQEDIEIGKEYPLVIDVLFASGRYDRVAGIKCYPGAMVSDFYRKYSEEGEQK